MLVEMHDHVLYGVDDGPRTCEEMTRMLEVAAHDEVRHLFCTSHMGQRTSQPLLKTYQERFAQAQTWCAEHAPNLRLHTGSEILYSECVPQMLAEGLLLPLEGTKYILVEFYPDDKAKDIGRALEILRSGGWQVILAHVERYRGAKPNIIRSWREELGVLTQMNAQAVMEDQSGLFRDRRKEQLLDSGLIDFISSDAHNLFNRSFCLPYAHRWLCRRFGQQAADLLCGDRIAACLAL